VTPPGSTPAAPAVDPAELEPPGLEIGTSAPRWDGAAPIAATPPGDEAPPYIPDPADYQMDAETDYAAAHAEGLPTVSAPQLFAAENGGSSEADSRGPAPLEPAPELPPPADPSRLSASRLQIRRVFGSDAEEAADGAAPRSLLIVVEALNATDEPVDANGEISLMVMAGETQETLKRVDRWDFTAEETAAAWQSSRLGDGLHLELPLDGASLPPGRLELWARLVGADGKKLLTRVPFAADDLTPLSEAAADEGTELVNTTDMASSTAQPLGANNTQVESNHSLNSTAPPVKNAASEAASAAADTTAARAAEDATVEAAVATASQWRPATASMAVGRSQGNSPTVGAPAGSWTSQPPGGRFPLPTPRVAVRTDAPPRWQQGAGTATRPEASGAWAPFR
ncbi:MAG TPA: hypothetical protein VEQ85_08195, partial [Lacipirellulaceae bacterium]|nr:hypothetical protein [Lacipirellulaceae bacterium]